MYFNLLSCHVSQLVKNTGLLKKKKKKNTGLLQYRRPWFNSCARKIPGEWVGYPLQCSYASLVSQMVTTLPALWETWVGKIPWRREQLPTPVKYKKTLFFLYKMEMRWVIINSVGLLCRSVGKESACNEGDLGLTPGFRMSSWRRK